MIYIKKNCVLLFLTLSFPLFSQIELKMEDGKVIIDKYNNGVFIPSDSDGLIVNLIVKQKGDSVRLSSYYSKDSLHHVDFHFYGKSNPDTLMIQFIPLGTCPIGFLRFKVFDEQFNLIDSYSLFDNILKIHIDQVKYFQIIVFNAKSRLFSIDDFFIKDNMIIFYDYIDPRDMEKHKFFDCTLYVGNSRVRNLHHSATRKNEVKVE